MLKKTCIAALTLALAGGAFADNLDLELMLSESCQKGNSSGCVGLELIKESKQENPAEMIDMLDKKCAEDNAAACAALGDIYKNDHNGSAEASNETIKVYRESCDKGSATGCIGLGLLATDAPSVSADENKALEYYKKACALGDDLGCKALGK